MSDNPVSLSTGGLPETKLPIPSPEFRHLLQGALSSNDVIARLSELTADHPRESLAWAELAERVDDEITRYAFFRVGYHRGLDALRANGWRGSGYVRWSHEGNRGFLRCLLGLSHSAGRIGEHDEEERCRLFLLQLDPRGVPEST
jgi:hypothetical protein